MNTHLCTGVCPGEKGPKPLESKTDISLRSPVLALGMTISLI